MQILDTNTETQHFTIDWQLSVNILQLYNTHTVFSLFLKNITWKREYGDAYNQDTSFMCIKLTV